MADRVIAYIDGESHYIRTEREWCEVHGEDATLEQLRYRGKVNDPLILHVQHASVFWSRLFSPDASRAVYFTSVRKGRTDLHDTKVRMREFNLENHVVEESKDQQERRVNRLNNAGLIEKPKGVDIALAVRMILDAHRPIFERCHLYTSDADFIPVIQAVQAQGKQVYVYGYRSALANESPLLHIPEQFIDLGKSLQEDCERCNGGGAEPTGGQDGR